ncbi:MAG: stalk domain-containing protein [Clostridia bacterium]|jgi:hypothetical protein|nr:stalk domain-containing protein [Clostridia bacterium]
MKKGIPYPAGRFGLIFLLLAGLLLTASLPVLAADGINLVIDGKRATSSPSPVIINDRTMVPVRLVSESLGATVEWKEETRSVHIAKGSRTGTLWVDNYLFSYADAQANYGLCDVPPMILDNRTFVPLRLVSNLLGVTINWDGNTRTVSIAAATPAAFTPFFDAALSSVPYGQTISGATDLRASAGSVSGAAELRFFLLDPVTGEGKVVARGANTAGTYRWTPDPATAGPRILAAAFYNAQGAFLGGNALPVVMAVQPQASLLGVNSGQTVTGSVSLRPSLNFSPTYVKYEITNVNSGKVLTTEEMDPYGSYSWAPETMDNGSASLKVTAYDANGNAYDSAPVVVNVAVERKVELKGITSSYKGETPVTLWFSRNFLVSEVVYQLRNLQTGQIELLAPPAGSLSYWWFPLPEKAGQWEMVAQIKDTAGKSYTTAPIVFQLSGKPIVRVETVGPNEVLTGTVKLKALFNTYLSKIEFYLVNPKTGAKKLLAEGDPTQEYTWTPAAQDEGYWQIQAVGTQTAGGTVNSEAIPVRIYLGKTYSPVPIIAKDKFQDLVSGMAVSSQKKTGMSAALQAAQAILETGWGQSSPTDKYTGKVSHNMFGIKGSGPAGAVISNTWEEYNGNTFRVDAEFRAYQNPEQSWSDHKDLLLTRERYQPFRDVMHNSTEGAWALKRCGYATDSKYPIKLINIINQYGLAKLDEVKI